MRQIIIVFTTFILIGLLTACGTGDNSNMNNDQTNNIDEEQEDATQDSSTTEDQGDTEVDNSGDTLTNQKQDAVDDNEAVTTKMKELNIKEIEIELEYTGNQEYEAEIEVGLDGTYTAELEDDLNNEYLKGQQAFDKIYPMVEKLDLTPESTKEDVFNQVLQAFDLGSDYEEIEVEMEFYDSDKELEYEEK